MIVKDNSIISSPSDERIQKLETYSNVRYPKSYINFLKHFNGAIPETNTFVVNGYEYLIERFLCITDSPNNSDFGEYDVSVVLSQLDERLTNNPELIGDELIPIAVLFAGDFVCLDYRANRDSPTICVWNHEESSELEPVTYYVSDSFEDFLAMLSK